MGPVGLARRDEARFVRFRLESLRDGFSSYGFGLKLAESAWRAETTMALPKLRLRNIESVELRRPPSQSRNHEDFEPSDIDNARSLGDMGGPCCVARRRLGAVAFPIPAVTGGVALPPPRARRQRQRAWPSPWAPSAGRSPSLQRTGARPGGHASAAGARPRPAREARGAHRGEGVPAAKGRLQDRGPPLRQAPS